MGRSTTPKYRLEMGMVGGCGSSPSAWRGLPTYKQLAEYVQVTNASFGPGGANRQIGRAWPRARIVTARISRQADGEVVTSWREGGLGTDPRAEAKAACDLGERRFA